MLIVTQYIALYRMIRANILTASVNKNKMHANIQYSHTCSTQTHMTAH